MGDTFRVSNPVDLLIAQAPDAIYIGWYWFRHNVDRIKYFIHTYENMLQPDDRVSLIKKQRSNVPLLLRASEDPDCIGTLEKQILYDYCFMGFPYCEDWEPREHFKGIYHATTQKGFLSYSERKQNHLASRFALGFQADENIRDKHVSQRIYEGLAYGCIVLTNSIPACEQTNGIAVYVRSKDDLIDKMNYYNNHPEEIQKKQQEGYEFIKKNGTNRSSIELFLSCIKQNFDILL
jgi:hypothetical protein